MRPSHLQELHAKRETNGGGGGLCPTTLKIHKDSHMVKKTSPSSSSSSSATSTLAGPASKQPQRHPVIIYTHSPKVIHTHPKDFMALVQKLAGLSRHEDNNLATPPPPPPLLLKAEQAKNYNDDNKESSSVITTDENNICGGSSDHGNSSSCFVPPPPLMVFDDLSSSYMNIPLYSSSTDYLCGNNQLGLGGFYSYTDSLFFGSPNSNMRSSITSNSGLEGIDEFNEY